MIIGLSWKIFIGNQRFELFDFELVRDWPWPSNVRGHHKSEIFLLFESPYKVSYMTSIDIFSQCSFRLRYILTLMYSGFDLDVWLLSLEVRNVCQLKAYTWLPIKLRFTFSLYLVPFFLDYLASKFLEFDLDLWPLKVFWGEKYFCHSRAHTWLPI